MTFAEFRDIRFAAKPWDFAWNERGFAPEPQPPSFQVNDMVAHLPLLRLLALQCDHVTEFGCRGGFSTAALIDGCRGTVVSYDINMSSHVHELLAIDDLPCTWWFYRRDTSDPNLNIEHTDLLLIDTLHTYEQVKQELAISGHKVRRWLVFHDTVSQGATSIDNPAAGGINKAIDEFVSQKWKLVYEAFFNHGLRVYEKR